MPRLQFSIDINASQEKVLNTMLGDKTYPQWTAIFSPDSDTESPEVIGSWEKGSKIQFVSADENVKMSGMTSEIAESKPYDFYPSIIWGL